MVSRPLAIRERVRKKSPIQSEIGQCRSVELTYAPTPIDLHTLRTVLTLYGTALIYIFKQLSS